MARRLAAELTMGMMEPMPLDQHQILNHNIDEVGERILLLEVKVERVLALINVLLLHAQAVRLNLALGMPEGKEAGIKFTGGTMAQQLGDSEQVRAKINPTSRAGNPAPVEAGTVVWTSTDEGIFTVVPNPENEQEALVVSTGPLGIAALSVSADANLGEGVETVTDTIDIEIVAGRASNLGLQFGVPEPKP